MANQTTQQTTAQAAKAAAHRVITEATVYGSEDALEVAIAYLTLLDAASDVVMIHTSGRDDVADALVAKLATVLGE